ncbi:valyl-tRNA synthetase [Hydrogenobacter thermophilus TK-6]|uniref:Valine--tRNA ligase n=1 Tax=Hydrogenobacter thermophilus (strain DSM 6534 / IAM 12695 / TK-6) TaxID=608538 RepID=D3DG08_HYDTT|nr:valine--tRNA ligase [Hydrogenobacter thermophilus]ADO44695.1 valyl-tRNA synthetase [Hydrogenobacter thermophilus TK-6]BAI68760.1 valyl-tRNA synthetase [Hydrogenobacter thermophilus TK-6]
MKDIGKYDHKAVESKHSRRWIESAIYSSGSDQREEKFSVVIPPPNVTGSLHMGHALNATLQDMVCRWQRMMGKKVVWVPGFDHAGIATQYVVDKKLQQEGKDRLEVGREEFLKEVWKWVPISRGAIREQLEKLGVSVDWKRERFTLDEGFSRAVRYAFRKLYEDGLIYRGEYIVNWCPNDLTALSDLEVEHEEEDGKLYYIKYPLEDASGYITVATTRPETMLGDTAVAVHPQDERYKHLVGKRVRLPLVSWKRKAMSGEEVSEYIPIVADESVLSDFGTGAVKITPAHDPTDFQIGKRHNLPFVQVMDQHARMNENAGEFAGLDRYEARQQIVKRLEELGLLEKVEDHRHAVGKCYRCKTTLEPMVSVQWFVRVSDERIKKAAIKVVEEGKIRFIPEGWKKIYLQWMENLKDWCISRQIWWGHRIPVWYCQDCGKESVYTDDDFDRVYDKLIFNLIADGKIDYEFTPEEVEKVLHSPSFVHPNMTVLDFYKKFAFHKYHSTEVSAHSLRLFFTQDINPMAILTEKKNRYRYDPKTKKYRFVLRCKHCGSERLRQEEDVLDTWFSSALWPFGVFGWPEEAQDLKNLYPTDLLVTGFDIIFFWVARMIMMGTYFTGDVPFVDVYIHALVRDEKGQKMSKTKGNVIDPLDIVERYGADALRFTLAILTQQGRDIKLSEKRFEGYKHFANKLWNAGRFILMNLDQDLLANLPYAAPPRSEDLWITTKLNQTVRKVNEALSQYEFSEAAQALYEFVWSEFCDWYLEMSKLRLYAKPTENLPEEERQKEEQRIKAERITAQATLLKIFDSVLKLLHPFMCYITEELYSHLPTSHLESVSLCQYPQYNPQDVFEQAHEKVEKLKGVISSVRALRSDLRIEPSRKIRLYCRGEGWKEMLTEFEEHIKSLVKVEELIHTQERPPRAVAGFYKDLEFFLSVEEGINIEELINSYTKRHKEVVKSLESVERRLQNPSFLEKASREEVEKVQKIREELLAEKAKLEELLKSLEEARVSS